MWKYAAVMAIAATSVSAQGVQQIPILGHCTYDWSVFERAYGGPIEPLVDPVLNSDGFGFIYAGRDGTKTVILTMPDGMFCVVWDSVTPGEPT